MAKYSSKVFKTSLIGQLLAVLSGVEGNKFLFSNENKLVRAWWPPTVDKIFPKSGDRTAKEDFGSVRNILAKAKRIGLVCTVYYIGEARNERIF